MRQLVRSGEGGLGLLGGHPQLPPTCPASDSGSLAHRGPEACFLVPQGQRLDCPYFAPKDDHGYSLWVFLLEKLLWAPGLTRDSPGVTLSLVLIKDTQCWWQVGKHGIHLLPNH